MDLRPLYDAWHVRSGGGHFIDKWAPCGSVIHFQHNANGIRHGRNELNINNLAFYESGFCGCYRIRTERHFYCYRPIRSRMRNNSIRITSEHNLAARNHSPNLIDDCYFYL